MNGRKAKQLRALAGINKENRQSRSYKGTNVKTKQCFHPTKIDSKGKTLGTGTYQTATYILNEGTHLLNKLLKKQLKAKQGIFALA